jgi:hypothetical protein
MLGELNARDARLLLAHSGYSPIPTNGKIPHCKGWQTWYHRDDEVIRLWDNGYRDHQNTGLLTRDNPFLDIDILNPEAAEAAAELVASHFDGYYLPLRIGQPPKRGFLFQLAGEPFNKITATILAPNGNEERIEFLANGNQVVVHGIHPDTHKPYTWHGGSPFECRHDDLAGIDEERAKLLISLIVDKLILEYGYTLPEQKKPGGNGQTHSNDSFGFDWSALHHDPLSHDDLCAAAMAMLRAGTRDGAVFNQLHAWIHNAKSSDEERRQRRLNELSNIIKSARQKITPPITPAPSPIPPAQSYADLKDLNFMPLQWVVPDYIPEGVTLLAGKPKVGKSWLALAVTMACAENSIVLDRRCPQRSVLYCALEDNQRRMRSRTEKLITNNEDWPANAHAIYKLPPMDQGCIEWLQHYVDNLPSLGVIIIDTLAKIRGANRKDEGQYAGDHRTMSALLEFAHKTGIAIIVIHHVRKQTAEDIFDTISGTLGLNGGADTLAVLTRAGDEQLRLAIRGRDLEEQDKTVHFDIEMGAWAVLGDYEGPETKSGTRLAIIDALKSVGGTGMSPDDLTKKTGLTANNVRVTLGRMLRAGQVKKTQYGTYSV